MWAKRLSWKETASIFGTSWDSVFRAIQWVVNGGIVHRDLTGIESIGIDEIQYRRGNNYLTLVYQLDQGFKRLLYVRKDRSEESLNGFFNLLDSKTIAGIKYACTDVRPAYLKVRHTCEFLACDNNHYSETRGNFAVAAWRAS